jgi:alkylation response protein AidB-like acyl-CoA dehydrogenase
MLLMNDPIDSTDEIVRNGASYIQTLEDKASWNGYIGSGILGMTMPACLGGQALPITSLVAMMEGLAYGGGDAAVLFAMSAQLWSVQYPILKFGTEEQKRTFIPPMMRGELRAAHAATEPEAGSDIFQLQTKAVRCPGGYCLEGAKRYITSAPVADTALVLASTDAEQKIWGLSAFLVDLNSPGVSRSSNIPKMGLQSAQFGDIWFEDCFVPTERRLGAEGVGSSIFSLALDMERSFIMAPAIGFMRRELELSIEHANSRKQHGSTIGSFQSVSNRIADMAMRLELCRLLIYRAATLKDSGRSTKYYSSLVKLALSEFYVASSMDAVRTKGALGYLLNDPSGINFRDAIGSLFYSGTSDILRNLIASHLGVNNV